MRRIWALISASIRCPETVQWLNKNWKDADQLIYCDVGGNCELPGSAAVALNVNARWFPVPFLKDELDSQNIPSLPGAVHFDAEIVKSPALVILFAHSFVSPKVPFRPENVTQDFFHETTHTMDYHLISRWVNANKLLQERGQSVDRLFLTFTTENEAGQLLLDEGFIRLFLESRAILAELEYLTVANLPEAGSVPVRAWNNLVLRHSQSVLDSMRNYGTLYAISFLDGQDLIQT